MLVYIDRISNDELLSDSFKPQEIEGGFLLEVPTNYIKKTSEEYNIGANPSAEGVDADENSGNDGGVTVIDLVDSFQLEETVFDKKSYTVYMKGYLKSLKELLPVDQQDKFQEDATRVVKSILGRFDDFKFYTGPSMDSSGMVVLLDFKNDPAPPSALYFSQGLRTEKQ